MRKFSMNGTDPGVLVIYRIINASAQFQFLRVPKLKILRTWKNLWSRWPEK